MRISDWSSDVCSSDLIMIADLDTFSVGLEFDGGSRAGGAHGGNGSGEFDGDHGNCLLNAMLLSALPRGARREPQAKRREGPSNRSSSLSSPILIRRIANAPLFAFDWCPLLSANDDLLDQVQSHADNRQFYARKKMFP